jgi:hypothetical protein
MTNEQLDREAHAAIDDSARRLPMNSWHEYIEDRNSTLCRLLRAVYFAGRQHGLAQAQQIYSEGAARIGK